MIDNKSNLNSRAAMRNLKQMSQYLEQLYKCGQSSDVMLMVGGSELRAHKLILATRSPVFAAMFRHEYKEKVDSAVDVKDVELDVFQEMLKYIYTGEVSSLDKHASELLIAAEKVLHLFYVKSLSS